MTAPHATTSTTPTAADAPQRAWAALLALRAAAGPRRTTGIRDDHLRAFLQGHPLLVQAIHEAVGQRAALSADHAARIAGPEDDLITWLQADFLNFYEPAAVNPYVPLAARGPWVVTTHGAVLHDSGGYGMLGFGHAPQEILDALSKPWVIANVMTPSFAHRRLTEALRRELGHSRPEGGPAPFAKFLCLNSGSESVSVAARISDIRALHATRPGGPHEGRTIKLLAIEGGFHGRTDRPAQASSSSRDKYKKHLASFQKLDNLVLVPPNDVHALRAAFLQAEADGVFFEMMLMEPVMGEGNPGLAVTRAFYDEARRLTAEMGSFLLVDSIQAGLRAQGTLSIVDYPGFADALPPDMETWSKAINAAQVPLSVLGLSEAAAATYERGVYGNTMTANPRAVEVGVATLEAITPALRQNIRDRGAELVQRLEALREELPSVVQGVQGTGLLVSLDVHPDIPVVAFDGLETWCREQGMGVIHGGKNALRFTPHFRITSEELAWMVDLLRDALRRFGRRAGLLPADAIA
jgi:acetylornithine/succinyldiaminopimelate/putrescine aminotransferase